MSSADDILFAPIGADWRTRCREIVDYMENYALIPAADLIKTKIMPKGALLLEEMCELYHEHKQDIFYLVYVPGFGPIEFREIFFDGDLVFDRYEDGGFPHMKQNPQWSLRDLNLIKNGYSGHFVFAVRTFAQSYGRLYP